MKYKKKLKNLELAKIWWNKQDNKFKDSTTTRPGGINQRVVVGS